jgi:hypothetical protein
MLCVILIYVFPACFEFSKAGLYHLASHVCSLSHNAPPGAAAAPPPPLVLQSVMDLGFQCSLRLFLTVSRHCLLVFYPHYFLILFSLISPSCTGLPLFLVPSVLAVAIYFGILWFCIHSISWMGIFYKFCSIFTL